MQTWVRNLVQKVRYRITHTSKFPKGDLFSFMMNLAERGFHPRHIVDVGANKAKWSRKAHWVYPDCHFTLIEPQIEMKPYLDKFCSRCKNATWINAGVADKMGELPLTVAPDTVSSSFAVSEQQANELGFERRIVPLITLDHLVQSVIKTIPDVVKIDAEGFESKIMAGASRLIGKTEMFLLEAPIIETPPGWQSLTELLVMMTDYGYEPYDFTTFQKRPRDGTVALTEVAFAKRNGILRSSNTVSKAA